MVSVNKIMLKALYVGVVGNVVMLHAMEQKKVLRSDNNWTPTAAKNLNEAQQVNQKNLTHLKREVGKSQQRNLKLIPFEEYENRVGDLSDKNDTQKYELNSSQLSSITFKQLPTISEKEQKSLNQKETKKEQRQAKLHQEQQAQAIVVKSHVQALQNKFAAIDDYEIAEVSEQEIDHKKIDKKRLSKAHAALLKRKVPGAPRKNALKNPEVSLETITFNFNEIALVSLSSSSEEETHGFTANLPENIPFFTPEKKSPTISSQFSHRRPAALRSHGDKTDRMQKRAESVEQHSNLSGKTWDNRAKRNLVEGRK